MNYNEMSLKMHEENKGKVAIVSKTAIKTRDDLSTAYTPGVAEPCRRIAEDKMEVYRYTSKGNLVAVVSDGTAVLGLGDIGPEAAMPVMEGKSILFKEFGDVDAFPICLDTKDPDEIVETVIRLAPTFGGINLEDISAPRCFEIEARLKDALDIPVFHDDQHGTAVVVLASIINGLKLTGKTPDACKVVLNGSGAAGIAIAKLLLNYGFNNITLCDRKGMINKANANNPIKQEMAELTNLDQQSGSLADALKGADIFIGVSAPGSVTTDMVKTMNKDPMIFAMANPTPEIMPTEAKAAGARIIGTGRSDFPNQINNVLVFPGLFRGALDVRAKSITEEMKMAAAKALASLIDEKDLNPEYIIPDAFDPRVAKAVAKAVSDEAIKSGNTK
ncbi:MAG: NAD-dependent malic enzyme [Clostridia bacterium]|nr:NAD-dependent malic enzyme [Clostridia bacterium]NCC42167.1 NAD-dependent malic enzyme [Clostridia bacterium]